MQYSESNRGFRPSLLIVITCSSSFVLEKGQLPHLHSGDVWLGVASITFLCDLKGLDNRYHCIQWWLFHMSHTSAELQSMGVIMMLAIASLWSYFD